MMKISGANMGEYGKVPLREGEETLDIMNGLVQLQLGSSLGFLIDDNERILRNTLFEPPPLCICNQEEISKENVG
jgi:hypothetical protein